MTGELRDAARAERAVNSGAGPVQITRDAREYDNATLSRLIGERDEAREKHDAARATLEDTEAERDSLAERVGELDVQLTAAHHDRDAAKATVRRQAAEILAAVDALAKAERELRAGGNAYSELLTRYDALSDARVETLKERDGARSARNSLARELEQVKAHVARQNDRITTLDAERDDAIQSRDFARQRVDHFSVVYGARVAALADDIEKAREQARKTQAEKGSRGFRRSKARERRAAALATVTALERVARRQP